MKSKFLFALVLAVFVSGNPIRALSADESERAFICDSCKSICAKGDRKTGFIYAGKKYAKEVGCRMGCLDANSVRPDYCQQMQK